MLSRFRCVLFIFSGLLFSTQIALADSPADALPPDQANALLEQCQTPHPALPDDVYKKAAAGNAVVTLPSGGEFDLTRALTVNKSNFYFDGAGGTLFWHTKTRIRNPFYVSSLASTYARPFLFSGAVAIGTKSITLPGQLAPAAGVSEVFTLTENADGTGLSEKLRVQSVAQDAHGTTLTFQSATLRAYSNASHALIRTRTMSQLHGRITKQTDFLTLSEPVSPPLANGERVSICAGVNRSDPAECADDFGAVVDHVEGNRVYFTQGLGEDIPVYDEAAFRAAYQPPLSDQGYKIGDWGVFLVSNFGKGFGLDHGLVRYSGAPVENVGFRNFNLVTCFDRADSASTDYYASIDAFLATGMRAFVAYRTTNFRLTNVSFVNLAGSALLNWYANGTLVSNLTLRGMGRGIIWNVASIPAVIVGMWGGRDFQLQNIDARGSNYSLIGTEINPTNISVKNVYLDVFMHDNSYVSTPVQFNYYGAVLGDLSMSNIILKNNAGGRLFTALGMGVPFNNLDLNGLVAVDYFDLNRNPIQGVAKLLGQEFQSAAQQTWEVTIFPDGSNVASPEGLYENASLRVLDAGDVRDVEDGSSKHYTDALTQARTRSAPSDLVPMAWHQLQLAPNGYDAEKKKRRFVVYWNKGAKKPLRLEISANFHARKGGATTWTGTGTPPSPLSVYEKARSVATKQGISYLDFLYTTDAAEVPPSYQSDGATWQVQPFAYGPYQLALQRCRTGSGDKLRHFLSLDAKCEGKTLESTLGYVSSQRVLAPSGKSYLMGYGRCVNAATGATVVAASCLTLPGFKQDAAFVFYAPN